MAYMIAKWNEKTREDAYKYYVTDTLYAFCGLNQRFYDAMNTKPDNRTAAEIIAQVVNDAGLRIG